MNTPGPSRILVWLCCLLPMLTVCSALASPGKGPILRIGASLVEAQKADLSIQTVGSHAHWELKLHYPAQGKGLAHFFFPIPEASSLTGFEMSPKDSNLRALPVGVVPWPQQVQFPQEALAFSGMKVLYGRFKAKKNSPIVLTISWRATLGYHQGDYSLKNSLEFVGTPDTLQLGIRCSKQRFAPLVRSAFPALKFRRSQGDFTARQTLVHPRRPGSVEISLPTSREAPRAWIGSGNDSLRFAIATTFPTTNSGKKKPRSLDIFWDCSFSGRQRNLAREIAVLDDYLRQLGDVQIRIHPLAHLFLAPKDFQVLNGDASEVLNFLRGQVYDGHPTQQEKWPAIQADEVLLFPGANPRLLSHPNSPGSQVYCLQSSAMLDAHRALLPPSSQVLNLTQLSQRGALAQLQREVVFLEVAKDERLFDVQVRPSEKSPEVFTVTGRFLRGHRELNLVFKANNRTVGKQTVPLPEAPSPVQETTLLLNQGLFPSLALPRIDNAEVVGSTQPGTGIPGPEDLAYRQGLLQEIWTDLSQWYDGLAPPHYATGEPGGSWPVPLPKQSLQLQNGFFELVFPKVKLTGKELLPVSNEQVSGDQLWVHHPRQEVLWGGAAADGFWLDSGANQDKALFGLNQPPGWQQSASYRDTLASAKAQAWQVYASLRKQWQASPSFFIDAADHFIRLGEVDHAEIVLSNLLAPGHEAPEVLRAAAHRLQALGRDDLALLFFERVYQTRPGIPPVIRDCALALAEQGQWQAALERLLEALYSPPELFRQQSPGLRNILLTELNHLLAASEVPLDRSQVPARWVRPLPLDLRVVIDWNRSDTDVDLLVTDPNGEQCNFDLPFTKMGGKLAGDVTDGFGPEAFVLKEAQPGKYTIEVEYDDDPELRLSGPSFVKVTIFTDYGRPTEQKQVIPLRLEKTSDQVQVATVEIH